MNAKKHGTNGITTPLDLAMGVAKLKAEVGERLRVDLAAAQEEVIAATTRKDVADQRVKQIVEAMMKLDSFENIDDRQAPTSRGVANGASPPTKRQRRRKRRPDAKAVVLRLLYEQPGASLGRLARLVYGSTNPSTRQRVSNNISSLNKEGKVKRLSHGVWEVKGSR